WIVRVEAQSQDQHEEVDKRASIVLMGDKPLHRFARLVVTVASQKPMIIGATQVARKEPKRIANRRAFCDASVIFAKDVDVLVCHDADPQQRAYMLRKVFA